jgi:hypothetical protein
LLEELRHRGVGPQDTIVLVAEWDTFYGRKLPETFMEVRWKDYEAESSESRGRVLRYSYLRGIDGKLPGESDRNAEKERKNGGESKEREDLQKGEEPEGKRQYDYLRRLAEAIFSREYDLIQQGEKEIKAIGVLGSDFHDKYLLLQALGQRFPEKIFFTTDLDARLLHPANLKWTRNLLVASGFGLQLREDLQGEIPPFREGYQAAVFLATLRALDPDDLMGVLEKRQLKAQNLRPPGPRISEIGRHHAIDLTSPQAGGYVPVNQALPAANFPKLKQAYLIIGTLLLIILAAWLFKYCAVVKTKFIDLVTATWQFIKVHISWKYIKKKPEFFGTGGMVILALLILFFNEDIYKYLTLSYQEIKKPTEEIFSLTEGISVWPTEIIRLVAVGLSLIFCCIAWFRLKSNRDNLIKKFHLGEDQEKGPPGPQPGAQTEYLNMDSEWKDYVARGEWWRRFCRFVPLMVSYLIFSMVIIKTFGEPFRPIRGKTTGELDLGILIIAILAFLFLNFFIFDVFMLCRGYITRWLDKEAEWSEISKRAFRKGRGNKIEGQMLSDWMRIRLIAKRTQVVGNLIFFPFIVWFILFLARQPYFDKYPTPIGLFIVITMGALLPWGCALMLRRSAEKLRAVVVERMSETLILDHWHKAKGEEPIEHLNYMLTEVKSARTGAFASYLQQPVWQSLMVPFGGVSIVTLIDYISKLP